MVLTELNQNREKKNRKKRFLPALAAAVFVLICTLLPGLFGMAAAAQAAEISGWKIATLGTTIKYTQTGLSGKVKWSSSDPEIFTVEKLSNAQAALTAKKKGTAVLTASAGGVKAQYKIKVCRKAKILVCGRPGENNTVMLANALKACGAKVTVSFSAKETAAGYDGLALPGGADIQPSLYGKKITGAVRMDPKLDTVQMKVLGRFVKAKKPVLGICRGAQLINVHFGGTLYQNIKNHKSGSHKVKLTANCWLSVLYGRQTMVNTSHHQAIRKLGSGLGIIGKAPDGTVEAIVHSSLPVYGVQWHPEQMKGDGYRLLRKWIRICQSRI